MGYDVKRFVNLGALEEELICSICFGVFDNPYILASCGHTFCKECIDKWFQRKRTCPNDGISVGVFRELVAAPIPLKNIISKLTIHCDYEENGCEAVIALQDLHAHSEKCEFKPKPPPTQTAVFKKLFGNLFKQLIPNRAYERVAERIRAENVRQTRGSPFRLVADIRYPLRPRVQIRPNERMEFNLHHHLVQRFTPHVVLSWFIAILVFVGFCLISFMLITFIDNIVSNVILPLVVVATVSSFIVKYQNHILMDDPLATNG